MLLDDGWINADCSSHAAWKLEGLDIAKDQYHLLDFSKEETVRGCKTMADRAVGGYSTANLDYVPADPETKMPAHARFHGSISTKLPKDWRVQRTGMLARALIRTLLGGYAYSSLLV